MKAIIYILFAIQASACLKITDKIKDKEPQQVSGPNAAQSFSVVQELEHPNAYRVRLPFPPEATVVQRLEKSGEGGPKAIPLIVKDGVLTDDQAKAGAQYVYSFGTVQDGAFKELEAHEVEVPLDLVVDREILLEQDETWNSYRRIFFQKGGVITTQGHRFILNADQMVSDEGVIRTFPMGAKAVQGVGRSGGSIEVNLRAAKGILKVELRGEQGGDGERGGPFLRPPQEPRVVRGPLDFIEKVIYPPGRQGERGQDGFAGGDSGAFDIRVEDEMKLLIHPRFEVGAGGEGGEGGPGEHMVHTTQSPGSPGEKGGVGEEGVKQTLCIYSKDNLFCH